jgi:hypothetical protein
MGITYKKQPSAVGIMLKPQHNVIADNVLQIGGRFNAANVLL